MIQQIESDIFEAPIDVLAHQSNCHHAMGSGIALQIKRLFPEAVKVDKLTSYGERAKLGTFSYANVRNPKYPQIKRVVNIYSQFKFGSGGPHTDYRAIKNGMTALKEYLERNFEEFKTLGIPFKYGCGLGGGTWADVEQIIFGVWCASKIDVLICKHPDFE